MKPIGQRTNNIYLEGSGSFTHYIIIQSQSLESHLSLPHCTVQVLWFHRVSLSKASLYCSSNNFPCLAAFFFFPFPDFETELPMLVFLALSLDAFDLCFFPWRWSLRLCSLVVLTWHRAELHSDFLFTLATGCSQSPSAACPSVRLFS